MGRSLPGEGRRRWTALIVVLLGIAGGALGPGTSTAGAEWGAGVAADGVNLRAEPGVWAPAVDQLWQGESVAILDGPTADGWYQVEAEGTVGWVDGSLLALDGTGWAWPTGGERWVDVDRSSQTVTLYEGDAAVASYWGAIGFDPSDDGFFATAVGTYYVYEKIGELNWTPWAGAWVQDWVGFDPNRVNGFHSYTMDANGVVLPNGAGPTGGCVALAPEAADQLFAFVSVGTRVEVHW